MEYQITSNFKRPFKIFFYVILIFSLIVGITTFFTSYSFTKQMSENNILVIEGTVESVTYQGEDITLYLKDDGNQYRILKQYTTIEFFEDLMNQFQNGTTVKMKVLPSNQFFYILELDANGMVFFHADEILKEMKDDLLIANIVTASSFLVAVIGVVVYLVFKNKMNVTRYVTRVEYYQHYHPSEALPQSFLFRFSRWIRKYRFLSLLLIFPILNLIEWIGWYVILVYFGVIVLTFSPELLHLVFRGKYLAYQAKFNHRFLIPIKTENGVIKGINQLYEFDENGINILEIENGNHLENLAYSEVTFCCEYEYIQGFLYSYIVDELREDVVFELTRKSLSILQRYHVEVKNLNQLLEELS